MNVQTANIPVWTMKIGGRPYCDIFKNSEDLNFGIVCGIISILKIINIIKNRNYLQETIEGLSDNTY